MGGIRVLEKETILNQENIENENSAEKLAEQVGTILKNNSTQDEEYDDEEEISVHDVEKNEYLADDYDVDNESVEEDEVSIKNNEYLADDYDIDNQSAEEDEVSIKNNEYLADDYDIDDENTEDAEENSSIESNEYLADDYNINDEITENDEDDFLNEDDRYLLNRYTDSDDFDGDTFESLIQEVQQTLDNISVKGKKHKHKHSMYTLPVKEEFFEEIIKKEETRPVNEVIEKVKNCNEKKQEIEEPIGGVYSVDEEKPLIGSFTLKEQPENNDTVEAIDEEKDVDVPIGGSFDVEPADVTVSGTFTKKRRKKEIYPQSPMLTVDDPDEEFFPNPELYADNSNNDDTDPDDEVTFVAVDNGIELEDDYVEENNFIDVLKLDDDDTEEIITNESVEIAEESITDESAEVEEEVVEEPVTDESAEVVVVVDEVVEVTESITEPVEKQTAKTLTDTFEGQTSVEPDVEPDIEVLKETVKESGVISDVETLLSEITQKLVSTEESEPVADTNEESSEEIGKEYGLDEEKPLTGSFKLKEQLEVLIEKDVETLDVPLNGSFGVEPAEVTVSGSYNLNDEKSAPVKSTPAEEVVAVSTVESVAEPVEVSAVEEVAEETKESVSAEEITTSATEKSEPVADTNEESSEEIGKEYGLDEEKPLTGSFKLKEQLESIIEKNIEALDVPSLGSFDLDPAEVTVPGKYETKDSKVNSNTVGDETISFVEGEKYDIDSIMDAIIRAAHLNGNRGVSPTKFAEQVKNILEKNQ